MALPNLSGLKIRLISGFLLSPIVIGILLMGGWPFYIMLAAAIGIALYEWFGLAWRSERKFLLGPAGFLYICLGFYCFHVLGTWHSALYVLMLVWASDICAYFAGKFIGGPKLALTISPNKTWAGLAGAILGPAIGSVLLLKPLIAPGLCAAFSMQGCGYWPIDNVGYLHLFIFAAVIGFIGQIGDLLVSAVKRSVNTKDTGQLIPGHGGLLDRIDSILLCAPMAVIWGKIFYAF